MKFLTITAVIATLLTGVTVLPVAQASTLDSLPDISGSRLDYEVRSGTATLYGRTHRDKDQLNLAGRAAGSILLYYQSVMTGADTVLRDD